VKSRIHETLNGHRVEYDEPDAKLARFLARVEKAMVDEHVTENEMIALVYSVENPLLESSAIGGPLVTKETLANPIYRVLADLLERKRVAARGIDIVKLAAKYTLTVAEAAEQLGAHENTVRKAIREGRLASWVKDGQHYLNPKWVDQFELATEKSRTISSAPSRSPRAASGR
jgi:excisionase family DNA binding protein